MNDPLNDRVLAAVGHQYQLEGEIGRGGMSVVYRARDRRLNRAVAIKVLPPELAYDPAIRTRFTRAAQTSAQLAHAHIVPIYDVGERDGIAFLVMALINGGNLATLLAREPKPPLEEVRRLLCEVAEGLSYAHTRGVVHRDIKPDNILLDADSGRAMVTDFGIARAIEAGTRLTVTGAAVGTPTYMSPEQAVGDRAIDGRSDIYSLGVLAYQMVTGRVPFTAGNSMALLLKHVGEQPKPIVEHRPEVPKPMRDAIERALMKAPEDRWPTAAAFREALFANESQSPTWRAENREPVRYASPRPQNRADSPPRDVARVEPRTDSPRRPVATADKPSKRQARGDTEAIIMEPAHLAVLTPEQRADLRLWHGRINLVDRIKAARWYMLLTLASVVGGITGFVVGVEEMPPLALAPLVTGYISLKMWRRGKSLRASGLRLRRVFLMPRTSWVLPQPAGLPIERQIEKLAPREVLDSPHGAAIRKAAEDRASILAIVASLPKADRALLPDVVPTVNSLVERVAAIAQTLNRLDQSIDPHLGAEIDARIAEVKNNSDSPEGQRRLGLLQRQRETFAELIERRASLLRQIDSAGLALGNLRLDLIKLRSTGVASALDDVSTATQEARALSREIGTVLEAVAELKDL
jgi:serine/threonine-protein kinase